MIDVSEKSWQKYFLFGSLYFSEGIEMAVVYVLIPIYLEELGISLPIISLIIGISVTPWAIKFVWGGIVDYFIGFGRKRFIIVGAMVGAIGFLLLAVIDPRFALIPFASMMCIGRIGISFLDVSADAWAIEITRQKERGKINGSMFAGQFAGFGVGSTLLAILANTFSYIAAFITAGLIVILIIIYPLFVKYSIIVKKYQKVSLLLLGELKKRTTQLVALFAPIVSINIGLLIVIPLYLKSNLELDIAQIGIITGIYSATMAVGSVIGGGMADKFGRKNSTYIFVGASVFFLALLTIGTSSYIFTFLYAVIGFLCGGFTASTSAICMDITNPRIGATQFSLLMGLFNLGDMAGEMIAGSLVVLLGYERLFLYSAWSLGPGVLILYFIRPKKNEVME